MSFEARVLYTFESVSDEELGVIEGEFVTVVDTTLGNGWCLVRNKQGLEGIVPESYVEKVSGEPEPIYNIVSPETPSSTYNDPYGGFQDPRVSTYSGKVPTSTPGKWSDEEFDSDEEHKYEDPQDIIAKDPKKTLAAPSRVSTSENAQRQSVRRQSAQEGSGISFNPLKLTSGFGKGNEVGDYLKGMTEASATLAKEAVHVTEPTQDFFNWAPLQQEPFTCKIGEPKKGKKFGGIKNFVEYPVTPSFSNIQVLRRYKRFDWLYEQLDRKFGATIAIPPLPDKNLGSKFEEELIALRRIELQSFVDRVGRHPVLANSEAWKHFITETDEKRWTQGKRRIEADNLVGIPFLTTIQAPSILSETETSIDRSLLQFTKDIVKMDTAVKNMNKVASEQSDNYKRSMKKEYLEIGKAFKQLSLASGDNSTANVPALSMIGASYEELAGIVEDQASKDWEPLMHMMHDYKGLVTSWQGMLSLNANMAEKYKEISREGNEKERDCSMARFNTYRISLQSEKNFFNQEFGADMNYISQVFVAEQINFHRKMSEKLTELYQNCWPTVDPQNQEKPPIPQNEKPYQSTQSDPLNAWE